MFAKILMKIARMKWNYAEVMQNNKATHASVIQIKNEILTQSTAKNIQMRWLDLIPKW